MNANLDGPHWQTKANSEKGFQKAKAKILAIGRNKGIQNCTQKKKNVE